MVLRIPSPHWEDGAKCLNFPGTREHDPWFDDTDLEGERGTMEEARDICNGTADGVVCPLRNACLLFAAVNNEHYGIWGGLYPEQRQWLRRNKKKKDWTFENAPTQEEALEQIEDRKEERKADREAGGVG